jgi:hypothetical protein
MTLAFVFIDLDATLFIAIIFHLPNAFNRLRNVMMNPPRKVAL